MFPLLLRFGRLGLLAVAPLAPLLLCAACSAPPAGPPPPLRLALHSDPLSLDPHLRNEALTYSVLRNIFEGLIAFDPQMRIGPALAARWENPDELTWRFFLRPGVRFHDGSDLTSSDVVFSLNRARQHPRTEFSSYLVEVSHFAALDDLTVEVTTSRPYAILLNKLAFVMVVPEGSPEEIVVPIGTGPYRLVSHDPGRRLELAAFGQYWRAPAAEPSVLLLPVADPDERLARLLGGQVDLQLDLAPEQVATAAAASDCEVRSTPSLVVEYLHLNTNRPPFSDRRVRQALNLALDRRQLVQEMLLGHGQPIGQMVGLDVFGYAPDLPVQEPDLESARQLITEAGYPHGLDAVIELRQGRDASRIRDQAAATGIRLQPVVRPWGEMYARLLEGRVGLYYGGFVAPSADSSDFFDSSAHSRTASGGYGRSNFGRYSNPALDELIQESGTTLNMLTRRALLQKCMRILMDDLAFIPLFVPYELYGVRNDIEWQPRIDGWVLAYEIRRAGRPG